MKKILTILATLSLLLLVACNGESKQTETEDTSTETQSDSVEEVEETEEVEDNEDKYWQSEEKTGTRTNPLSTDQAAELKVSTYVLDEDDGMENDGMTNGKATMKVSDFIRGEEAMEYLRTNEDFDEEPENDELEWVIFNANFKLDEFEDDNKSLYVTPMEFSTFELDGSPIRYDSSPYMENSFGNDSVYSGGTIEGPVVITAKKGEPFLLNYTDMHSGQEIWFEVK